MPSPPFTLSPCPVCSFTEEQAKSHCTRMHHAGCLFSNYLAEIRFEPILGRPVGHCRNCGFTILSDAITDPYELAILWNSLTPKPKEETPTQ